jgi:hypothetical protein
MRHRTWPVWIGIIGVVATTACGTDGDRSVRSAIAMYVARGNGSVVTMASAAPFEWERLHVFAPYTPPEQADAELGFRCQAARTSGISARDDVTLLVFVSGKRVVRHVAHPRVQGDFSGLHRKVAIAEPKRSSW